MYKGQIENFPKEVVEKMLGEQVKQGNKRNVSVFEHCLRSSIIMGGFDWDKSEYPFLWPWLDDKRWKDFSLFFKLYPKYPKVMEVSDKKDFKGCVKRVVFTEKCGYFLAWDYANTLEEAENEINVVSWKYVRDIKEKRTLEVTIEDIAQKFGVDASSIKIVK